MTEQIHRLPICDQIAVNKFVGVEEIGELKEEFYKLVAKYPDIERIVDHVMDAFPPIAAEDWGLGFMLTTALLDDSIPRTGGEIPTRIPKDMGDAPIRNIQESSLKGSARILQWERSDPLLVAGLMQFSERHYRDVMYVTVGGFSAWTFYNSILQSENLAERFDF